MPTNNNNNNQEGMPPPPPSNNPPSPDDTPKRKTSSSLSPRKKSSVSGALFHSLRTHISVVRSAIPGHRRSNSASLSPRSPGGSGSINAGLIGSHDDEALAKKKEGELYNWNEVGAPTPQQRQQQTGRKKRATTTLPIESYHSHSSSNLLLPDSEKLTPLVSHKVLKQQQRQELLEDVNYHDDEYDEDNGPAMVPVHLQQPNLLDQQQPQQHMTTTTTSPSVHKQYKFYTTQATEQSAISAISTGTSSYYHDPYNPQRQTHSPYSPANNSSHSKQSQRSQKSKASGGVPMQNSWSWSEQFFFSQDDESVSVSEEQNDEDSAAGFAGTGAAVGGANVDGSLISHNNITRGIQTQTGEAEQEVEAETGSVNQSMSFPSIIRPVTTVKFDPIKDVSSPPIQDDDEEEDDATCNNTIVEKVRQRSKKASRASTVGAFVTFLKALFGIGMLSNPAVLGEVGLVLGTFCHLFIVVGCAFACYLLLAARQMAKMEVMAKQRRDAERREEYDMWRREMEGRAALRAGRKVMVNVGSNGEQRILQGMSSSQMTHQMGNGMCSNGMEDSGMVVDAAAESNANPVHMMASASSSIHSTSIDQSGRTIDRSGRTIQANNTGNSMETSGEEEWTVAPVPLGNVPLHRVHTSMLPPKQGWGRCEEAMATAGRNNCDNATNTTIIGPVGGSSPGGGNHQYAATTSCAVAQVMRQRSEKLNDGSSNSRKSHRSGSTKKTSSKVSDEYQRFTDNIHNHYMAPNSTSLSSPTMALNPNRAHSMPLPPPPVPPPKAAQVRLVTYGDVAKYLAGKRASFFIIFTIVTVHLMFASGMVHLAVENLCYVIGWERLGWSYVEEYVEDEDGRSLRVFRRLGPSEDGDGDDEDHHPSRSSDEEEYYLEWKGPDFVGRLAMASLLFPIIHSLLQIPNLTELATISTLGLVTYAVGCIGSMLYTAVVLTDGHPFLDHPDDMWKTKWSGIPTYVATTIYCIEGINLALPTVSSIEGTQRWGGGGLMMSRGQSQQNLSASGGSGGSGGSGKKEEQKQDLSVFIVVGAVFLYGMVTLVVSWVGLGAGLGGGIGTVHGEDGCWDVTYCLNSSAVRFVYMLSLGVALVLTLPVILYPSTEMLEVWLDERNDERRRKMEAAALNMSYHSGREPRQQREERRRPFWRKQKSLLPDDETVYTVNDTLSPRQLGIKHADIEMKELSCSTHTAAGVCGDDANDHNGMGGYVAPSVSPEPSPMTLENNDSLKDSSSPNNNNNINSNNGGGHHHAGENVKLKAKRKLKYWKLRMFLAFIICVIGTIEGSFPSVLKAAEVLRGVGLSIAGLIFPPLLYMSAVGGNFSVPMAAAMALLIGLGLFNIVLVLMSAFGSRDFIVEEGRGSFYDM